MQGSGYTARRRPICSGEHNFNPDLLVATCILGDLMSAARTSLDGEGSDLLLARLRTAEAVFPELAGGSRS